MNSQMVLGKCGGGVPVHTWNRAFSAWMELQDSCVCTASAVGQCLKWWRVSQVPHAQAFEDVLCRKSSMVGCQKGSFHLLSMWVFHMWWWMKGAWGLTMAPTQRIYPSVVGVGPADLVVDGEKTCTVLDGILPQGDDCVPDFPVIVFSVPGRLLWVGPMVVDRLDARRYRDQIFLLHPLPYLILLQCRGCYQMR